MPFPAGADTITLTGTVLVPLGGTANGGQIVFTPSARLVDSTNDTIYSGSTAVALDTDGSFSVELLLTDSTDLEPTGWVWQVEEKPSNGPDTAYTIELTDDMAPAVDLADVAPVSGPGGGPVSGVQSVNGQDGVVVLDAADVGADAAGSAAAAQAAAATDATTKVNTHEADTTSVHGITDTSVLATGTDLATAVSDHAAATDPHGDRAYADGKLAKTSNLSDVADTSTARSNLGLGTAATRAVGTGSGDVAAGDAIAAHSGDTDPHGDRAYADGQFLPLDGGTVTGPLLVTGRLVGHATPYDHGFKAWAFDPALSDATANPADGAIMLAAVYPLESFTATRIWWYISTAGSGLDAGQNFVGLYDSTGTRLAAVGVDTEAAGTGAQNTTISVAVTAGQLYWVAFLFNGTTRPAMPRAGEATGGAALSNINLTAANMRFAQNGTGTSLPSTITPASNTAGSSYWAAIA